MWRERSEYTDDPLSFVIKTVTNPNTITGKKVKEYMSSDVINLDTVVQRLSSNILDSESSLRKI